MMLLSHNTKMIETIILATLSFGNYLFQCYNAVYCKTRFGTIHHYCFPTFSCLHLTCIAPPLMFQLPHFTPLVSNLYISPFRFNFYILSLHGATIPVRFCWLFDIRFRHVSPTRHPLSRVQ